MNNVDGTSLFKQVAVNVVASCMILQVLTQTIFTREIY